MPDDDGEELPGTGDTDLLDIDALLAGTPADVADLAADAWGPEAAAPRASAEDAGAREAGDVDLDALLAELSASAGAAPDTGLPDEWAPDFSAPDTPADHEAAPADAATGEDDLLDLDALLGEDPAADPDALPDPDPQASGDPGLDALPAEESFPAQDDTDFDDLSDTDGADAPPAGAAPSGAAEEPFGRMSLAPPDDLGESRRGIRIALMGDFSGRASRGICETGDALARRKPIRFDIDRLDEVIARFATTLVLPLGPDGAGIEVPLASLDDLHPDALHDNVEVFAELAALRRSVARGDGAAAIATLRGWAAGELPEVRPQQRRAKGAAVPADRRLSDFRALIGAPPAPARPEPAEELIRRIVAPHVRAAPDPDQPAMLAAVDEALSAAMRAILHHPDFQAVEATWRALELIARRVGGAGAEIVLYDVSAEEWAADLAAQEDLAQSGLFRMLAEEPRLDEGQGALSAVFGLYTLEETPPHAELMARMSRISAWMEAPFVTAISTRFLETPMAERAPLVRRTWEALRALPEARYVGLAAPRFLLRLPYGRRTEPVEPFDFEEFRLRDGLKGMLWANPVVLCAILMAETANRMGPKMRLGEVMSLDDMPLHHMTDEHGDQVALPCTERLLDTRRTAEVVARGFMPVLSLKGRNAVRQGSFQSLSGGDLAGPWASAKSAGGSAGPSLALAGRMPSETDAAPGAASGAATRAAPGAAAPAGTPPPAAAPAAATAPAADDVSDDALSGADSPAADSSVLDDLDALLASFADDDAAAPAGDDDGMDPELAALLKDL
ncbi:type VI secretion system contractile sheath domain-containing protein [Oceanicella sp. SM1341]|uniref:type VI secretion system contractile sheath domain-containing protein n=1 Tax=Oceanicella sp. SM1341 TaxID=1548889 RepID=UPI003518F8B5